jgi:general secretion pathway protein L
MSTLVLQLPERQRLRAGTDEDSGVAAARRREYAYVTSDDGIEVDAQGHAAAALLPTRSVVIAVIQEADVSWHRITLPKAPASRLRMALVGVIEEALLEDAENVHLAVAPLAVAGQPTWVAAVSRRSISHRGKSKRLCACLASRAGSTSSGRWLSSVCRSCERPMHSPISRLPTTTANA